MVKRARWVVGILVLAAWGSAAAYGDSWSARNSLQQLRQEVTHTYHRMQTEDRLRQLRAEQERMRHRIEAEENHTNTQVNFLRALHQGQAPGGGSNRPRASTPGGGH